MDSPYKTYIVAYIDLLGHTNLSNKIMSLTPDDQQQEISKMKGILTEIPKNIIDALRKPEDDYSKENNETLSLLTHSLNFRCLSDSLIYYMDITELEGKLKDKSLVFVVLRQMFIMISIQACQLLETYATLVRGGIEIGRHYEHPTQIDSNISGQYSSLFIMSEAYLRAVELEKTIARWPRIVVGEHLLNYFNWKDEDAKDSRDFLFHSPDDNKVCLDIYQHFKNRGEIKERLKNIVNALKAQMDEQRAILHNALLECPDSRKKCTEAIRVFEKVVHFRDKYHNPWCKRHYSGNPPEEVMAPSLKN